MSANSKGGGRPLRMFFTCFFIARRLREEAARLDEKRLSEETEKVRLNFPQREL